MSSFSSVKSLTSTISLLNSHYYLTSGILKAYLSGLVTEQEREELEHVLNTDPDVLAQLSNLETAMEGYFWDNAVPPPPGFREKLELRLSQTGLLKKEAEPTEETNTRSSKTYAQEPTYIPIEVSNTHIRVHKNWRTAFIAIVVLSKIFLIAGLYYYFKSASQEQEIIRLNSTIQQTTPLRP